MENKSLGNPWVILAACLIGLTMVASDISRLVTVLLVLTLPLLFYISQRPFVFILKCMLVIVFLVPFQLYDFLNPLKLVNPLVLLGVVLFIKFFADVIIKKHPIRPRLNTVDKIYFVFLFSALISSFYAISILGSLNWLFYSVTTGYLAYRAILTLDFQEVKGILRFLVFVASLSALYGIGEYAAGHSLIYGRLFQGRLTSLMGHPLVNGLIFASVLPFSLVLAVETGKKIFIVTSAVIFCAILLTFARGSWLALAIGLGIIFFLLRFQLKLKLFVMMIALVVLAGVVPNIHQAILRRLNESEAHRYSSLGVRAQSFPTAFSVIKDKPFFGGGPFNSFRYKELYNVDLIYRKASFENSYLDFLVDIGIVGTGILVLFCLTVFKAVIFAPLKNGRLKIYRVASFVSLIILLLNMATFNFDSYRIFHFIIWFSVGLNCVFLKQDGSI